MAKKKSKIKGNNIYDILERINMSQIELSDLSGIGTAHLSRIINHERMSISLPIASKIAKALNLSIEEVFIL